MSVFVLRVLKWHFNEIYTAISFCATKLHHVEKFRECQLIDVGENALNKEIQNMSKTWTDTLAVGLQLYWSTIMMLMILISFGLHAQCLLYGEISKDK